MPKPENRLFIYAHDVADLLEFPSKAMFLTRRKALEDMGFPTPCAWVKQPLRWRRDDVVNWLNGAGRSSAELYLVEPTPSAHRKVVMKHMAGVG